jgi:hypothetical protein
MIGTKRLTRRINPCAAIVLFVAIVLDLSSVAPSAAQGLDPAQKLEDSAAAARQKAAILRKNADAWDGLIKANRDKAAAATDAKSKAAFEELAKKQEDGARKMRDDAEALTRSADADAAQAAQIRGVAPTEATTSRPQDAASSESFKPSKGLLDYAEVAKADIAVARPYLESVAAEIGTFATRFASYRDQANRLRAPYEQALAESHKLEDQRHNLNSGATPPQWTDNNIVTMPDGGKESGQKFQIDGALSTLRKSIALFDGDVARMDSLPATAAKMKRAFSESQSRVVIDNTERDISFGLQDAVGGLWGMHLWEAGWQYHLLSLEYGAKVWNIEKSYTGDVIAAQKAYADELDRIDKNIRNYFALNTARGTNTSNQEIYDIRDRPSQVAGEEYARRIRGVCERAKEQTTPYAAEIAQRLQAVAEHLHESHSRVVEDFFRVITRIEQDKSGIKADAFAPIDEFLKNSKTLSTEGGFVDLKPANFSVFLYAPFHGCDWITGVPRDLDVRFPAVTAEFEQDYVKLYLAFTQSGVIQGEAEARAADARP